ncbi:chlorophyll a/b-binding family protein [Hibiscus syriacus]|uniref:Chlorophyll a/b-binding family protein n=1 Tax=Hibiscus syriacus TaxID=106335 RepID=A0A6A3AAA9_HIBSY|nr:chlorophyll a/b-binding family protein [Hibiscus syriacus]
MSRQGGDPTMVSSSIALLQERFRQLQKVREKREEKELLKLFSEPDRAADSIKRCEPNGLLWTFQPEVAFPSRQPQQDSLPLGLNSMSRQTDFRAMGIPASTSLWPNAAATSSTSKYYENSDVDTSLHL